MAQTHLNTNGAGVDFRDVQGLARFGFGHLTSACYVLLNVENAGAACGWLEKLHVTTAERLPAAPSTALQIAFTGQGLLALGVPERIVQGFSHEFVSGMTGEESRSRRLGDVAANAPAHWHWGASGAEPHILLMLFGKPAEFPAWKDDVLVGLARAGLRIVLCLGTSDLDGFEPFGFRDGISQPEISWNQERPTGKGDQLAYAHLLALGELLLGYRNEYGKYTDRPLIAPGDDPNGVLPLAEDAPALRDLGRNGTFLVFRQLCQDVRGFWRFLDEQARGNEAARSRLAELFVGRTREGLPLVGTDATLAPQAEEQRLNDFTYESDPEGHRCPFGAHIRRANPRNADLPPGSEGLLARLMSYLGFRRRGLRDDLVASTRFHRLLRRGREYGPGIAPEDAVQPAPPGEEETGLHFICLNANIGRQFEFVQSAWMMGTKFNGLTEESDPLMGNREHITGCPFTNTFAIPKPGGLRQRVNGLPQFVTVRGGGYFFMPGIRALRFFATVGRASRLLI